MAAPEQNLYDILQIRKDASIDEIKNAYKRMALKTHPDRLSPDATPMEREARNEQFRLVNNAYQVLSDKNSRKEYDRYGVWPPPRQPTVDPMAGGGFSRDDPFSDPFFQRASQRPRKFTFSFNNAFDSDPFSAGGSSSRSRTNRPQQDPFLDPFELFDRMFPDMRGGGMFTTSRHDDDDGFGRSFGIKMPGFGLNLSLGGGFGGSVSMASGSSSSSNMRPSGGQWVSQSTQTISVNGVTQTVHKYEDSQGNKHVRKVGADGRESYTINGVEQNPQIASAPAGAANPQRQLALEERSHKKHRHSSRSQTDPQNSYRNANYAAATSPNSFVPPEVVAGNGKRYSHGSSQNVNYTAPAPKPKPFVPPEVIVDDGKRHGRKRAKRYDTEY